MIMSEWKEYRLNEIGTVVGGATPSTMHPEYYDGSIPWITPKDLTNWKDVYISKGERSITEAGYKSASCKIMPRGSVLFSSRAPIGYIAIAANDICTNQGFKSVVPNPDLVESVFLYYSLLYNRERIKALGSGTTFAEISGKVMSNVCIRIPSLQEQRSIASILSALDSKIENNRKICANLEAQAQALFKHWFIDFAPFKDGKFVESELGMIPEGWRVGTYSDIIKDTISGDWGKDSSVGNYNHKVACIRGCDFQDVKMGLRGKTPERFILEKNFQSKHFENKDVLVEISGGTATVSTGRVCPVSQLLIDRYNGDVVCTNFCKLVRPIDGYSSYLYYSWKYKYDRKVMFGYENGTSGIKNFSIKDFTTREPLVLPTLTALYEFEEIVEHIHIQIQNYGSESSKLANIRDTLLPKLMSGEIKV